MDHEVQRGAQVLASASAPRAEFAYVDETGDSGPLAKGGSRTYTLGCVLVPMDQWTERLDAVSEIRRSIKQTYEIRLRAELKANYLVRPRGPLKGSGLGDGQLRDIYRRLMMVERAEADTMFTEKFFSDSEFQGRPTREARRAAYRMIRRKHNLPDATA